MNPKGPCKAFGDDFVKPTLLICLHRPSACKELFYPKEKL